jgi:hypothetical protein
MSNGSKVPVYSGLATSSRYAQPDGQWIRAGYSTISHGVGEPGGHTSLIVPARGPDGRLGISLNKPWIILRTDPKRRPDLVVAAMNVQPEVGGNLAEILETISHTIRERVRIKGEIRVLTAQVLYSGRFWRHATHHFGRVVPVNGPYMMEFFNQRRIAGLIMLTIGALMIISGYFVMMKIANIEV